MAAGMCVCFFKLCVDIQYPVALACMLSVEKGGADAGAAKL